jgi:hypothetical protein
MLCLRQNPKETPMQRFAAKHQDSITGTLGCFDRVIFHGHLHKIMIARLLLFWLIGKQIRIADLPRLGARCRETLESHARAVARRSRRPFTWLKSSVRQEAYVKSVISSLKIRSGLVCVLSCLEPQRTVRLYGKKETPRLADDRRPGKVLYFYYLTRDCGLIHVRIQLWFPFLIQVYVNGHEWLARQMTARRWRYEKQDNAFTYLADPQRAQQLADEFVKLHWLRWLDAWARHVNPLLFGPLEGLQYYWVTDQAEYSVDVLFRSPQELAPLFKRLKLHASLTLGAQDVLSFLGKRCNGSFHAEVTGSCKYRYQGYRLSWEVNHNRLKMYDKFGQVLRTELTINNPYDFRVWRRNRNGEWARTRLPKSVCELWRYEQVARNASHRLLDALAEVDQPRPLAAEVVGLTRPAHRQGRRFAGLNPLRTEEQCLIKAVLDAAHHVRGFRNQDIRRRLWGDDPTDPVLKRRRSAKATRLLHKLHSHGLIKKIPRTHRWAVTPLGLRAMGGVIQIHERLMDQAA